MKSKIKLPTLILACICYIIFCSNSVFAQKIKSKNNIVSIDGKEVLIIDKIDAGDLKSYTINNLSNDTLIKFIGKTIILPQLPYESQPLRYFYFDVYFTNSQKSGQIKYSSFAFNKAITELLISNNIIQNGEYFKENEYKFIENECIFTDNLKEINKAIVRRNSVLENKADLDKVSALPKRNAFYRFTINESNNILVKEVKIGEYSITERPENFTITVKNNKNKNIGSIFYEKNNKRVFIRTFDDNKGNEYFITEDNLSKTAIEDAIQYFIDNAYL